MARKSKTPLAGGASRDSFGGLSRPLDSLRAEQAQFLMLAHAVRPELAVMLATAIFQGGGQ